VRQHSATAVERSFQVDVDLQVPFLVGHLDHTLDDIVPCVIDQNVDPAEAFDRIRRHRSHLRIAGYVNLRAQRLAPQLFDLGDHRSDALFDHFGDNDVGAALRQGQRDGTTDALPGAGDDGNSISEFRH
jgi:hypothetical protein